MALPSAASATGLNYGYYEDVCTLNATPAFQTVDLDGSDATVSFTATTTKKPDFVQQLHWALHAWQWVDVKAWGCDDGSFGAPSAPSIAAPNIDVTWTVLSGPNSGATGHGLTDENGKVTFSYTGCGCGKDIIKIKTVEHWCEEPNTPLISCPAGSLGSYTLRDEIMVMWINCHIPPPPPTPPWSHRCRRTHS